MHLESMYGILYVEGGKADTMIKRQLKVTAVSVSLGL
jgi:hypothetical protein